MFDEFRRLLNLWPVAAVLQHHQLSACYDVLIGLAGAARNDLILSAPDQQRGQLVNTCQQRTQAGVMQIRLPSQAGGLSTRLFPGLELLGTWTPAIQRRELRRVRGSSTLACRYVRAVTRNISMISPSGGRMPAGATSTMRWN